MKKSKIKKERQYDRGVFVWKQSARGREKTGEGGGGRRGRGAVSWARC